MDLEASERGIEGTILIVDDHPIVRRGLRDLVDSEPSLSVCASVGDAYAALDAIEEHDPDLALVDVALEGLGGLDLTKQIRSLYQEVAVLMISLHSEEIYAQRALQAGASGYIMKTEEGHEIVAAIRQILSGGMYFSDNITERVLLNMSTGRTDMSESELSTLSDRELEVFRLIGQGYAPRDIAEELNVSVKTVETHRQRVKDKLGLETASQLRRYAIQWYKSSASV